MALSSPGVEVSVIDESFYTPAAGATTPLIVVATAESKPSGTGTGTAAGTLATNKNKVYLITSQRELTETFGNPTFYVDSSNNPLHGNELNEYGLQAAYSYLGVANRAYVVRANVNLAELQGKTDAPAGAPADGTYWFDTDDSLYGIFQWNGSTQTFTNKTPTVISASSDLDGVSGATYTGVKSSVGAKGDYAVVTFNTENKVWYKNEDNAWVQVGSYDESAFDAVGFGSSTTWNSTTWVSSWPTITATLTPTVLGSTNIIINNTQVNNASTTPESLVEAINGAGITGVGAKVDANGRVKIYSDGTSSTDGTTTDGAILIQEGSGQILTDLGITAGYYKAPELQISAHSSVPLWRSTDNVQVAGSQYSGLRPTGSVYIKTTTPNVGASWKVKLYSSGTGLWSTVDAPIYNSAAEAIKTLDAEGGVNIATGKLFILANITEDEDAMADFKIYRRQIPSPTSATGSVATPTFGAGTKTFTIKETVKGSATLVSATVSFTGTSADDMIAAISDAGLTNVVAEKTSDNKIKLTHKIGGEIRLTDGNGTPVAIAGFSAAVDNVYAAGSMSSDGFVISNWKPLTYEASAGAPTSNPANGTLWYNTNLDEVDIMYHDGTTWRGYTNALSETDPAGPIVSATEPTQQSDGTALVNGDIWVNSSNSENYGSLIYKYDGLNLEWKAVDVSDQTSEDGILFADARYGKSGATGDVKAPITEMLASDYLDPDAPDPDLYPRGMLLWNTRRSGNNVKEFNVTHININENSGRNKRFKGTGTTYNGGTEESMASYKVNRWVGYNTTAEDGSGLFGRKAQRKTIVAALKAQVDTNDDIRDEETRAYTLLSAPGYPELTSNLVSLNIDRGITGFVVADTPFRLGSSATELQSYGNNSNNALADGEDGFLTYDEYMATFYPSGFTTDLSGNNIVVPPSHMMLRTIALSDQVSFPWFAPAGTRRGGISNASSVGFIDSEGEFKPVSLNDGTRDTMQGAKLNPITFITGSGLVNFGQVTRARNASALDRINVARLVAYLRRQLNLWAKPFLFEPNDKITRDEIKQAAESLLLELVGQRALYDFLVVCDETNNTPSRIDRNELYLDIAIEPVKAVEFIYIPLRLKNTGEIATLGAQ
jgi:hypothetical protein